MSDSSHTITVNDDGQDGDNEGFEQPNGEIDGHTVAQMRHRRSCTVNPVNHTSAAEITPFHIPNNIFTTTPKREEFYLTTKA